MAFNSKCTLACIGIEDWAQHQEVTEWSTPIFTRVHEERSPQSQTFSIVKVVISDLRWRNVDDVLACLGYSFELRLDLALGTSLVRGAH